MKDYSKYFGKEWSHFLAPFLHSMDYYNIGATLKSQTDQGIEITPGYENIFRAFKECSWYQLHTIIIGQDVYCNRNKDGDLVADGIAFSANNCVDPPSNLNAIYNAIGDSVYGGNYEPISSWNPMISEATYDLKHWAKQGILLLNCSLTTIVGRSNEHLNLWKPFINYVIKNVTDRRDNLGIIMMGNHAQALRPLITNNSHFVAMIEHPQKAEFEKRSWKHENAFWALDMFHKSENNVKIQW